jgi:putative peptidoglycan lipid II flippase
MLGMLALGIPGFCVFLYAARALQAMQDLRAAFWLYVVENGINIVAVVVLAGPLGVRGIALSISIAYSVSAILALLVLCRRLGGIATGLVTRPVTRVLVATVALVLAAALASNGTGAETTPALLLRVVFGAVAGLLAYFAVAGLLAALLPGRSTPHRGRHASRGRLRE